MTLLTRAALVLIRLHPPAWRRRYADEVSALVEQSPVSVRGVVDLAVSAGSEWTRAAWRGVVIEPGRRPHPGRLVALWVLTVAAFYVGASMATVLDVGYHVGLVLSYGLTGRAIEILSGETNILRWGTPPPFNLVAILDIFVFAFLWFGLPAIPVIAVGRISGLGRRFPLTTRLVVALAFSTVALWLLPFRAIGGALFAGWVLASAFFPRQRGPREATA